MSDPYVFGDSTPEDAWHPDDPLEVLIDNLRRRLADLGEAGDLPADPGEALEVLAERLHRLIALRDTLGDLEQVRIDLAADDLTALRSRLAAR